MPAKLTTRAVEQSTFAIIAAFTDETGQPVVHQDLTWSLTDMNGVIVNGRQDVSITPAASVTIVLHGADLAMDAAYNGSTRILLVKGTYTSSLGSGLEFKDQVTFWIADLVGVPV